MATLEEGLHASEFIVSEANGHRSRLPEATASPTADYPKQTPHH